MYYKCIFFKIIIAFCHERAKVLLFFDICNFSTKKIREKSFSPHY